MKFILMFATISLLLCIAACSLNTGSIMVDKPAYLKFIGSFEGVVMNIDDGTDIVLNPDSPKSLLFQYPTGVHVLLLSRNGTVILKKQIILESGQTTEVVIP
jgi:hypothetical protein